jgi:peptide/nickel transport system permease protein
MVLKRILKNKMAIFGLVILLILVLGSVFAPLVAPYSPNAMKMKEALRPPGTPGHLLGTDELGRDLLTRLIYGGRISLTVGLIVVAIAGSIGVFLGAISGFYGGWVDALVMRVSDIIQAFPFLVLALAVVAIVGPSLTNMMVVLGAVSWVEYARLVRGLVLSEREKEYISASLALGQSRLGVILLHILPNCLSPILVQATFGVASAILAASALSFLGMGAQAPTPEWGAMLNSARAHLKQPYLSVMPGVAIMITVLAINFVGDALRDALDPRLSQP